MAKNIFVIGPDESNLRALEALPEADNYRFHTLLPYEEVKERPDYPMEELMQEARVRLNAFEGSIDAIVAYWDFPVSSLLALLSNEYGLPAPSLQSIAKCEHKYWSRLEQLHCIPEATAHFARIDPFDPDAATHHTLDYPFWVKPIKSLRSHLAYFVRDEQDLVDALAETREHIPRLGAPFNYFLSYVDLPDAIHADDGYRCIGEQVLSGHQCTLEGYIAGGQVAVYGIVDSLRLPNRTTFASYQYPSRLPEDVQKRMARISETFVHHIGLDQTAFNIEFFYDEAHDRIWLLEINPRVSQSHSFLFEKVDGVSNLEATVRVALGELPEFPTQKGPYNCAGKFFIRHHEDAIVERVPTQEEIDALAERLGGAEISVYVEEGMRLWELWDQDSYSYELASVSLAANDFDELEAKHQECISGLWISLRVPVGVPPTV